MPHEASPAAVIAVAVTEPHADAHRRLGAINVPTTASVRRIPVGRARVGVANRFAEQEAGARTNRGAFPPIVTQIATVVSDHRARDAAEHGAIDGFRAEDLSAGRNEG